MNTAAPPAMTSMGTGGTADISPWGMVTLWYTVSFRCPAYFCRTSRASSSPVSYTHLEGAYRGALKSA